MTLPTIVLHDDTSPHAPENDLATHSFTHQQPSDNDLDMIIAEDPPTPDHPGYSGSDTSAHLPPSSNIPTEVSSAVTSDSDLPPLPNKQTGLLNFFSVVPGDEAYTVWAKRKRDNRGKDEEERAKVMHQEEELRESKHQKLRDRKRLNQQEHRKRVRNQEENASMENEGQEQPPVSKIPASKTASS